jgi:2-oxo-4-hydroxy-4-carboxy-5-ureidoimidazoline decarboxylase
MAESADSAPGGRSRREIMKALQAAIENLNSLDNDQFREVLLKCSGSPVWCEQMTQLRPFSDAEDLIEKSGRAWEKLSTQDWLAALSSHPKIGDVESLRNKFTSTASWASGEQSGVYSASEETLKNLAEGNARYEERFGHIFIVFASGKSAEEMLSILNGRLGNSPEVELLISSAEHKKITQFRIEKLRL